MISQSDGGDINKASHQGAGDSRSNPATRLLISRLPPPKTSYTATFAVNQTSMPRTVTVTIGTTNGSPPSPGQLLKVYLLAGQSNADGRALTNGLPPALATPQNDVLLYSRAPSLTTRLTGRWPREEILRPLSNRP